MSTDTAAMSADPAVRPFHVDTAEETISDLRRRIAAWRPPEREPVDDQSQGVQLATVQDLASYWAAEYDWRRCDGCAYRARGRELLARTGSLARVSPRFLRVLPKVVTPPTGMVAFTRYACVQGPGIAARWNKVPARHRSTDVTSEFANLLLLPWPMRVRESDFRPVVGSVQRLAKEPYGFFEFAPAEAFDLDLLDRVLIAAREEVNSVDVVVLPESAISENEIGPLERLLDRHGVGFLYAGVRQRCPEPGRLPGNWLHGGINPRLEKGATVPSAPRQWFHIRQNKHHRWALDQSQVLQYHLGGVLHPDVQWWEAMEVPRLAVEFIEVAELTLVTLVCQDLASSDELASLIRSVAPTVLITVLLDGPQLTSRWAARYASVLADDPGSTVLTLTSFGMAQRSRPHGDDASSIIALWKDPRRGVREIPLEAGAYGVVVTICMNRATRAARMADGRSTTRPWATTPQYIRSGPRPRAQAFRTHFPRRLQRRVRSRSMS